ncbi:ATP-binding protein [Nitrospira moscoviensis]|uniref:histidine kinase n=1 Tax=Nitrospira moscoviensis TaxID=42253 RepID=A0A0K2GAE7_NITMO|nr:ATP-binding protein [Nitrospira moscoviensis]ALA57913.1 putative Histidine kinase [Nitrospira moscoviensis]
MGDGLVRSGKSRSVSRTLAGIFGLLLITTVSVIPLTYTVVQSRRSDAVVIDVAGRQRMLLERYMKELLLAETEGTPAYRATRDLLEERVAVLMDGGPTVMHPGETAVLRAAPTQEIRAKLDDQQRRLRAFSVKAERFVAAGLGPGERDRLRSDLLHDNAALLDVSNEIVTLFTRHSEEGVQRLIRWELVMVLLVVAVATVRTWRFIQAEQALTQSRLIALEALRQRDAVKSSLLSSVSHELRTPLTAIKTMLSGLREEAGAPLSVRAECLDSIDEELDYLNRLVCNLLDMSRIEGGALVPRREWHLLEEVVEAAIRRAGPRLARRPFDVRLSPDVPPLFVDGVEMQQVLVNLLDNAVKFSPEGSPIALEARVNDGRIEIGVTNEGDGIPASDLERVFERFYRTASGRAPAPPGTGLGLAVCKGIVEAHGGRIVARSVPGEKTAVAFWLPMLSPPQDMRTPAAPAESAGRAG